VYRWWVFLHLVGVFGFLASHGVSMTVSIRLLREREPRRVSDLLQLSGSSARLMYVSLGVLLTGGIVAGFIGHWWSSGWIWASLAILVLSTLAMLGLASPYYRRVGFVARAMAEGETSLGQEQLDQVLRAPRGKQVISIGAVSLLAILYLMLFKPSLGLSASAATPTPTVSGPSVSISATEVAFDVTTLDAPTGTAFTIVFDNKAAGVPHNVSVYRDSSASQALFTGEVVTGPTIVTYEVSPLDPGTYFFRCDVHPTQMTGDLVVK
jgi:plastocyanin